MVISTIVNFFYYLFTFWDYKLLNFLNIILISLFIWVFLDLLSIGAPPVIEGIAVIPGYPIVGNIFQVLNNPSKVYSEWSKDCNTNIFQIRLGTKRIVVVNSFEDVENLWIKNSCANNSRPVSYTFHDIVSITQGFTIGSTPAGLSFQQKKKAISMNLNRMRVNELAEVINNETKYTIKKIIKTNPELSGPPSCNMFRHIRCELADIDLMPYAQLFALRSSIYIAYGLHIDCYNKDAKLAKEIIEVESQIIKFRSPVANLQDFLPILRYIPGEGSMPVYFRNRRDKYMNQLFHTMKKKITEGNKEAINSLVGRLLTQDDKISHLTYAELQSLCLTMVSAGLDNTPLNFNHLMGHFSQPYGERIQERAFQELISKYKNNLCLAWDQVSMEIDCDFLIAIIKETLRYFTVLPLSLPRVTTKDINYKGAKIPKNTTLFMNAYAANHDSKKFSNPNSFIPDRWLDLKTKKLIKKNGLDHFSFGAGSRMCSGNHLAFKELYTLTARMILIFKIKSPVGDTLMELDPFKNNSCPSATSFEPKLFKVRLEPRFHEGSNDLYNKILRN